VDVWQASEDYSAPQLAKRCVLFALEHVTDIISQYGGGGMSGSAAAAAANATTLSGAPCADSHAVGSARSSSAASDSSHDSGSQSTASPCSSSGSQVRNAIHCLWVGSFSQGCTCVLLVFQFSLHTKYDSCSFVSAC
jgi:hypothetical protein